MVVVKKSAVSRATVTALLAAGMVAGAAGVTMAQSGDGIVTIGGNNMSSSNGQVNTQDQLGQAGNLQGVDQLASGSVATTGAASDIGDTSTDGGDDSASNGNTQEQAQTGGGQTNAPTASNDWSVDYTLSGIGGDVDNSVNGSGNVSNSGNTDISAEIVELLVVLLSGLIGQAPG